MLPILPVVIRQNRRGKIYMQLPGWTTKRKYVHLASGNKFSCCCYEDIIHVVVSALLILMPEK